MSLSSCSQQHQPTPTLPEPPQLPHGDSRSPAWPDCSSPSIKSLILPPFPFLYSTHSVSAPSQVTPLQSHHRFHAFFITSITLTITMAAVIAQVARPSIRHFSAHRPRPDSRAARAVAMSCLVSGVVLPFVPPALESSRQRNSGSPNSNK